MTELITREEFDLWISNVTKLNNKLSKYVAEFDIRLKRLEYGRVKSK